MKKNNIPVFSEEDDQFELDEALESVAWDLCGRTRNGRVREVLNLGRRPSRF